MSETLKMMLLALLIVVLYVISSRWRPGDESQRIVRTSYWIGLAVVLLILVLYAILRSRSG